LISGFIGPAIMGTLLLLAFPRAAATVPHSWAASLGLGFALRTRREADQLRNQYCWLPDDVLLNGVLAGPEPGGGSKWAVVTAPVACLPQPCPCHRDWSVDDRTHTH
jgi:hypothetical protein